MEFLVYKDAQQHGPYEEEDILHLLQDGYLDKEDLVFYEGMEDWAPLESVFVIQEAFSNFEDDGQDEDAMFSTYNRACDVCSPGETIFYIALQNKRFSKSKPDGLVATDRRLILIRHKLASIELSDFLWSDISSIKMRDTKGGSAISFLHSVEGRIEVEDIPREQVLKLFQLGQELRESARSDSHTLSLISGQVEVERTEELVDSAGALPG